MAEKRSHPRARIEGATIQFGLATADAPTRARVHDIGRGGIFIATDQPTPIGKAVTFEIKLADGRSIEGAARGVWVRAQSEAGWPAGVAVKLIDIDDAALAIIDEVVANAPPESRVERTIIGVAPAPKRVASRERTQLGLGVPRPITAPKREQTVLGLPPEPISKRERTVLGLGAPPAPISQRERTVLGVAPPPTPPPTVDATWDEVASELNAAAKAEVTAPEPDPTPPADEQPQVLPEAEVVPALAQEVPLPEPEVVIEPVTEPDVPLVPEVVIEPVIEPVTEPIPKLASLSPLPVRSKRSGVGAWIVGLLLLAGVGVGGWYYVTRVMQPPPPPLPAPTITSSPSTAPTPTTTATDIAVPVKDARAPEGVEDASAKDAADASSDAGRAKDASAKAKPPKPKTTASDEPY